MPSGAAELSVLGLWSGMRRRADGLAERPFEGPRGYVRGGRVPADVSRRGRPTKQAALAAQPQGLDQLVIAIDIGITEIPQVSTASTDEFEQATPGGVVMLVLSEVIGETYDAISEQRDLDFG